MMYIHRKFPLKSARINLRKAVNIFPIYDEKSNVSLLDLRGIYIVLFVFSVLLVVYCAVRMPYLENCCRSDLSSGAIVSGSVAEWLGRWTCDQ